MVPLSCLSVLCCGCLCVNACILFQHQVGHKLKSLLPSMTVGSFIGDTLRVRHVIDPPPLSWVYSHLKLAILGHAWLLSVRSIASDCGQVRHPYVSWAFHSVLELSSSSFLLRTLGATELELKGQFLAAQMEGQDVLLFMGSVRLSCLEELQVRLQQDVCRLMLLINNATNRLSTPTDFPRGIGGWRCDLPSTPVRSDATSTCLTSHPTIWQETSFSWPNS